jgi:Protein NO VEIN, C-terminal
VNLERIEPGFKGDALTGVLVVFVARNPEKGGQYIVGWYKDAIVYREAQPSTAPERMQLGYYAETEIHRGTLLPEPRREQMVPRRKGALGIANVWYLYDEKGKSKVDAGWVDEALEFVDSYRLEDAASEPQSESDAEIASILSGTIEKGSGYQSNPEIRKAIEKYAMCRAHKYLKDHLGLNPEDCHTTNPYDFECSREDSTKLYVEVKGTQGDGRIVSLTRNEVEHAKKYPTALFILHSVKVTGTAEPKVSGGEEVFLEPSYLSAGDPPEPRVYTFKRSLI